MAILGWSVVEGCAVGASVELASTLVELVDSKSVVEISFVETDSVFGTFTAVVSVEDSVVEVSVETSAVDASGVISAKVVNFRLLDLILIILYLFPSFILALLLFSCNSQGIFTGFLSIFNCILNKGKACTFPLKYRHIALDSPSFRTYLDSMSGTLAKYFEIMLFTSALLWVCDSSAFVRANVSIT